MSPRQGPFFSQMQIHEMVCEMVCEIMTQNNTPTTQTLQNLSLTHTSSQTGPTLAVEAQAPIKPSDIGYFYPNMPWDWGDSDVVEKEGKIYYRNVYAFTNRVHVAAQTRDAKKLKAMLDTCFHGEADLWWTNQLDNILRTGYIRTAGVDEYCKALENRFRPPAI